MDRRAAGDSLPERDVTEIRRTTCVLVIGKCGDCLASLVDQARASQLRNVDSVRVRRACLDIDDLSLVTHCAHGYAVRPIGHRVRAERDRVVRTRLCVAADRGRIEAICFCCRKRCVRVEVLERGAVLKVVYKLRRLEQLVAVDCVRAARFDNPGRDVVQHDRRGRA